MLACIKTQPLNPPVRPVCPEAPVSPVEPLAPASIHNASHSVTSLLSSDSMPCLHTSEWKGKV